MINQVEIYLEFQKTGVEYNTVELFLAQASCPRILLELKTSRGVFRMTRRDSPSSISSKWNPFNFLI